MEWIDRFTKAVATPLPDKQPIYWNNGLIKHLGLPDKWPIDWDEAELQEKAFVFFLESFDPPENLQGLAHQLTPLRYVILRLADNSMLNNNERDQMSSLLDLFIEQAEDYISIAPKDERNAFVANQLSDIRMLALWRFHFHCSQVVRERIDQALNLANDIQADDKQAKIISVSKIEYLRDGSLDPVYRAIAPELHLLLRRKQRNKGLPSKEPTAEINDEAIEFESKEKKQHDIYVEALSCEHCVHLAHYLLEKEGREKDLKDKLLAVIRNLSDPKFMKTFVSDLPAGAATAVVMISSHIRSVHNLIATLGSYSKRKSRSRSAYTTRASSHSGRLLPPGRYEEGIGGKETTQRVAIDNPLDIINGIFDDSNTEGSLHRRYGQRPKVSDEFGEGEDDYKSPETISIPASWLVDPYRNAIKQRAQMESLIIHQEPPIWSSLCLRVETIQQYLQSLSSASEDVSLLASLAFYTGLPEKSMQSMKLGLPTLFEILDATIDIEPGNFSDFATEAESKWTDIYLNLQRMEYVYLLPKDSISYYSEQSPDFIRNCEPASRVVKISLPEVLQKQLECYLAAHVNGSLTTPDDSFEPTSYAKLFKQWKKAASGWTELMADVGRRCHENVTPARIRATFRALFVGQAGLAPLHANLIMNEIPTRYRAQHFYSNINGVLLKQQYHDACQSIQETLRLDTKSQGEISEEVSYVANQENRFGSRLVPEMNALSEYFKELHALFINDVASPAWCPKTWNIMTLYIFRLLQLSTGMRPVRDRLPQWPDISFQTRTIRLSDKDNLRFYESRIIPLATAMFHWLGYFAHLQKKYFIATNFHLKNILPPFRNQPTGDMFSYIDTEHKIIRPSTLNDINRLEEENGLASMFPFKPNALRHNLLTRLNENNVDQHIIDFIMGHKHFGGETFGRLSPISSLQYTKLATQALDEFLIEPLQIPLPPAYA